MTRWRARAWHGEGREPRFMDALSERWRWGMTRHRDVRRPSPRVAASPRLTASWRLARSPARAPRRSLSRPRARSGGARRRRGRRRRARAHTRDPADEGGPAGLADEGREGARLDLRPHRRRREADPRDQGGDRAADQAPRALRVARRLAAQGRAALRPARHRQGVQLIPLTYSSIRSRDVQRRSHPSIHSFVSRDTQRRRLRTPASLGWGRAVSKRPAARVARADERRAKSHTGGAHRRQRRRRRRHRLCSAPPSLSSARPPSASLAPRLVRRPLSPPSIARRRCSRARWRTTRTARSSASRAPSSCRSTSARARAWCASSS